MSDTAKTEEAPDYKVDGDEPDYIDSRPLLTSPDAAAELMLDIEMGEAPVEECWALLLDTRHRLTKTVMISRGSIDHTFMSPRDIYREALKHNAAALIVGHNHPSGDPTPSRDDESVTRRLSKAGDLIGVDLLDHIVIGGTCWRSLARQGTI